mmetsp:Transcript_11036/g.30476  ORF Transcript_11036/g.30476 Transcript_11036/m.30476 type:complete len:443 (-) Transcript_11036:832-2160(-)
MEHDKDNSTSNKTIVIVDPVTEWRGVVAAAKQLQYTIVACFLSPVTEKLRKFVPTAAALQSLGVDHVLLSSEEQPRDVYACARDLKILSQRRCLHLEVVIPLSETAVEFTDILASMLGVPAHNGLDTILCRRDKGFMKEAASSTDRGLRVAKFARVRCMDDVLAAIRSLRLNYPVVIKTPQGFSSTDVFICETQPDAAHAMDVIIDSRSPDGRANVDHALLEEYIEGDEFAVNVMAFEHGDCIVITDLWRYAKQKNANYSSAEICDAHDARYIRLLEYAKEVVRAVGIRYGAGHVELKAVLEMNEYVRPMLVEVGARLSGGSKATMSRLANSGWNPFQALIRSHLGASVPDGVENGMVRPKRFVRHLFLSLEKPGVIHKLALPDFSELSTCHTHAIIVKEGDAVDATSDITSCAGFVWLVGEREVVDTETDIIQNEFRVEMG